MKNHSILLKQAMFSILSAVLITSALFFSMPAFALSDNDQAFLSRVKLIAQDMKGGDLISIQVDQAPESFIKVATQYCDARKNGTSADSIVMMQAVSVELLTKDSPALKELLLESVGIDDALAVKYYCPEFAK